MKIEAQTVMRKGFEEEVAVYNKTAKDKIVLKEYVAGEGRKGILNQIQQFQSAIATEPAAIVIQPTDNSALAAGLQEANRKNIPVIAYDQYIVNGSLTSFITSDNYQAGIDNANYILKTFPKDKDLKIVVFDYPSVSSTMERVDGFFQTLRRNQRSFSVLKKYEAVDPESGLKAAQAFLKDFPNKNSVDLVLTVNDGGGVTIVKKILEKKRSEIKHVTFDGTPVSVENIKKDRLTVINSAQFSAELGRQTARSLIAYLNTKKTFAKKFIPTFPITKDSVAQWPGFYGDPNKTTGISKKTSNGIPGLKIEKKDHKGLVFKIGLAPLCPYLCYLGPGKWEGYIYDILQDAATTYGFQIEIESIPNTRLINNLQARKVQYAIMPSYMTRYRSDIVIAGPTFGVSYVGALLPLGTVEDLIDHEYLKNKAVVYADLGDEGGEDIIDARMGRVTKLTGSDVSERMIRMLNDRRAQVALADYNVLQYYTLKRQGLVLKLVPTSLTGFSFLTLVSSTRDSQFGNLSMYLEDWMVHARKSGRLEKILMKYNLNDWEVFLRD